MAYRQIVAGSVSQIVEFPIFDSSSAVGALLTGLLHDSIGLTARYDRQNSTGAAVEIPLVSTTKGVWASGGFVEPDPVNMPGVYQLGIPDAALISAAGVGYVKIYLNGAANMVPVTMDIEMVAYPFTKTAPEGTPIIPDPAPPDYQTIVFIPLSDNAFDADAEVYATVSAKNIFDGYDAITREPIYADNKTTYYQLVLPKGIQFDIIGKVGARVFYSKTITVTAADTAYLSDY